MIVWISNVPVACKVSGRNNNDDQFTITKTHTSFTTDDTIGTEHGIWRYTVYEHSWLCQARVWQYGVDQALLDCTMIIGVMT